MSINAITVCTVRERERESYTLVTESAVLFNSLTHTSNCLENKEKVKIKKRNKKDSDKT